jgi:hypothetical protein
MYTYNEDQRPLYEAIYATAEDLREIWRRGVSEGQEDGREEVRAYFRKGLGLH